MTTAQAPGEPADARPQPTDGQAERKRYWALAKRSGLGAPTDAPARRDWAGEIDGHGFLEPRRDWAAEALAVFHRWGETHHDSVLWADLPAVITDLVAALRLHELEDERDRLLAEAKVADRVDGELRDRHDEFLEAIGARIPEEYDGEDAMESIVLRWLDDLIRQRDEAVGKLDALRAGVAATADDMGREWQRCMAAHERSQDPYQRDRLEAAGRSYRAAEVGLRALLAADTSTTDGTTTAETGGTA